MAAKNYQLLFWVDGFTNIGAAFLLLTILPKVSKVEQHKPTQNLEQELPERKPHKDKSFLYFIFFQIIFAACFFQLFTTIPLYFKKNLLLSEDTYGLIMALTGLQIVFFEMIIVYTLEKKQIHLKLMSLGSIIMAFSYLMLNFTAINSLLIAVTSMLIITIAEMISMPFMNSFYTARATEKTRGAYAGMYTMAWSLAQVIGSFGGAAFAEKYGFNSLWYLISSLCLIAGAGYYWIQVQEKNK